MKKLINLLHLLVDPKSEFTHDEWILKYKVRTLISVSFLIAALLVIFTLFRLTEKNYLLAVVDGSFALYLMISGYYLRSDKYHYDIVSKLFLVFGMAVIFLNLHLAEATFTRVLWFSSYILIAFFLRDKKEGFVWLGLLLVLFSLVAYFEDHLRLDMINYVTFVVNLFLISIVLFWYEKLKEGDSERLKVLNDSLQVKIDAAVLDNQKQERLMIEQAKMAAMGEMLESIAHQWRQPLNVMGLSIAKVEMEHEMGLENSENLRKTYAEMSRQISYMSQTIDDFRSFYKKDKELQEVKLATLLYEVEGLVSPLLKAKNIKLTAEIDGTITLSVYVNELKQVLLNLITNAKDAHLERKIEAPMVNVSAFYQDDGVMINIFDNAGGIDEDILNKIFEPYFTTKFSSTGTGIGLYMSKVIIEEHMRGKLSVENSKDGALFKIFLPVVDSKS